MYLILLKSSPVEEMGWLKNRLPTQAQGKKKKDKSIIQDGNDLALKSSGVLKLYKVQLVFCVAVLLGMLF